MGNFCNVAGFVLYLLISRFVTFVERFEKESTETEIF